MPTYVYRNVTSNYTKVYDGITVGPAGVTYAQDNITLNKYVPGLLDRWVDGVFSILDVQRPDPVPATAQEILDHQTLHSLAGASLSKSIAVTKLAFPVTAPAATFTGITLSDSATFPGFLELTGAGVHGLSAANATAGCKIYITWSGGTGVSGYFTIKASVNSLKIVLDTPSAGFAGMGTATPTYVGVGNLHTLATATIPGNTLRVGGKVVADLLALALNNLGSGVSIKIKFGGTAFTDASTANNGCVEIHKEIYNTATNTQVSNAAISAGPSIGTSAAVTGTVDTSVDQTVLLQSSILNAGSYFKVESFSVKVE